MGEGWAALTPDPPHAIVFPYPVAGHINPMVQLSMRLVEEGFFVTFVNTEWAHKKIMGGQAEELEGPRLRFEQVADGLPEGHPRVNVSRLEELTVAILALSGEMARLIRRVASMSDRPPPTCIIADSICSWMQDVADQFGIPRIAFWTTPAHANLAFYFQSSLIERGYIPISASDKRRRSQEMVSCIPGVAPIKLEDLISAFLVESSADFHFLFHLRLCMRRHSEAAWNIGNNVEELEAEAVKAFQKEVPNFVPIGPLLLRSDGTMMMSNSSLQRPEEMRTCTEWLDAQPPRSVLYISFGSVAHIPAEELSGIINGVLESGVPFLWVVRPDQAAAGGAAFAPLQSTISASPSSGLIVPWAPQLSVLKHPSVAAFFTHCGWNSLLESFCAGVPVIARPGDFLEQRMNAHYVSDVWRLGVRLPDNAPASLIASHIRSVVQLSSSSTLVFRERVARFKETATAAQTPASGSSYKNFRMLLDDISRRKRKGAPAPACRWCRRVGDVVQGSDLRN